ncbi:MAG TPA: hypothetical protein PK323_00480 [Bacteroidia bacterium]|nr:hypothetical protein [Bacteroidia bacterium]
MNTTKIKSKFLHFSTIILMIFIASCAPEPTEEPVADFTGTWTCNETTSNPAGSSSYSVRLKKVGSSVSDYKIENFYNLGFSNEASVNIGSSSITISSQTIGSGNSAFTASGSGSVTTSTKLSMNYKMDDGSGAIDNCTATFTKQ